MKTLQERLFSRLVIQPGGCVLWTGATGERGYGLIRAWGNMRPVHRVMWELFCGPIPEGMEIDHLCRVHACAAPAHLEIVTHRENVLRGDSPSAINARKQQCPAGHPFDYIDPCGKRSCRRCNNKTQQLWRARRKSRG